MLRLRALPPPVRGRGTKPARRENSKYVVVAVVPVKTSPNHEGGTHQRSLKRWGEATVIR